MHMNTSGDHNDLICETPILAAFFLLAAVGNYKTNRDDRTTISRKNSFFSIFTCYCIENSKSIVNLFNVPFEETIV